jgi:hypothetical protein
MILIAITYKVIAQGKIHFIATWKGKVPLHMGQFNRPEDVILSELLRSIYYCARQISTVELERKINVATSINTGNWFVAQQRNRRVISVIRPQEGASCGSNAALLLRSNSPSEDLCFSWATNCQPQNNSPQNHDSCHGAHHSNLLKVNYEYYIYQRHDANYQWNIPYHSLWKMESRPSLISAVASCPLPFPPREEDRMQQFLTLCASIYYTVIVHDDVARIRVHDDVAFES